MLRSTIDRELGRGGMGAVFEACHLRTDERVALKTLPVIDPANLHRFKREFRSMAEINHPNLIERRGRHVRRHQDQGRRLYARSQKARVEWSQEAVKIYPLPD